MQRRVTEENGRRVLVLLCDTCDELDAMLAATEEARASGAFDEVRHAPACCAKHDAAADILVE